MRFLVIIITFCSFSGYAAQDGRWYLGTGILNHGILKWSQSDTAKTSFLGVNYFLPLQLRYQTEVGNDWYFTPRILYTPIAREAKGGGSKSTILLMSLPFTKNIDNEWDWSAGLTMLMYSVSGDGGTTVLNNGTSTSTFYLPERTATAKNLIMEFGTSYTVDSFNYGLELFLISPLSNRRSYSLLLSFNYGLGD